MGKGIRSIACKIAKELAVKEGGKPSDHMGRAWKLAKQGYTSTEGIQELYHLFLVRYKSKLQFDRSSGHSIVLARDEESAKRFFNNPDDEFGPKYEIEQCKKVEYIPSGYVINYLIKEKNTIRSEILEGDAKLMGNKLVCPVKNQTIELTPETFRGANKVKKRQYNFL